MGVKRLLSDTDSQRGIDARFATAVVIGKVSKIECDDKRANVRVLLPDRKDHAGTPMNTKPVPVLQIASQAKRSYAVPRINDQVVLIKLANGTSDYLVVGSFYTTANKPPVSDPKLDYTEWEGGHKQTFDANDDADPFLKQEWQAGWDCTVKGDINIKTTDSGEVLVEGDGDVTVKSNDGDVTVKSDSADVIVHADGSVEITGADEVVINAPTVRINGNIVHDGNMTTSGVHEDSLGFHTGAAGVGTEMWSWTTSMARVAPTGQVGINAPTWDAATVVRLSTIAANNRDMTTVLDRTFQVGNEIHLQLASDATRFGRYVITGAPTVGDGYREYPVAFKEGGGALPGNNASTAVSIIDVTAPVMMRMAALEARIAALEGRT